MSASLPLAPIADRDEAARVLAEVGALQRDLEELAGSLNRDVAELQTAADNIAQPLRVRLTTALDRLEAFATTHRDTLTGGGKAKSVKLPTGTIGWKAKPASVLVADDGVLIAHLEGRPALRGLFLRTVVSVDRQNLLKHRADAEDLPGVTIRPGEESFYVSPLKLSA